MLGALHRCKYFLNSLLLGSHRVSVQLAPGDDLGMSYMYSLLNYIAATSKEGDNISPMNVPNVEAADHATLHSAETGLRGLSEDEKRLVGISTISVVTRLALEFDSEEVRGYMWI